jgi:hypothetical protein
MKRDNLSREEQIQHLRLAFDSRVTHTFCLLEREVEEMLDRAPSGIILQAFTNTGKVIRKDSYQEEEIVQLVRQNIERELEKLQRRAA